MKSICTGLAILALIAVYALVGTPPEEQQRMDDYHAEAVADAKKAAQMKARELRAAGFFERTDSMDSPVASK